MSLGTTKPNTKPRRLRQFAGAFGFIRGECQFVIEIWVDQEDGKERTAEMLLSHWGEFMENRICYLNDLDQEHRRNVLEKHLAHFIGQKENANVSPSRKQGHIRITRELIITGTSNPTLEIAQPNRMECIATLTL